MILPPIVNKVFCIECHYRCSDAAERSLGVAKKEMELIRMDRPVRQQADRQEDAPDAVSPVTYIRKSTPQRTASTSASAPPRSTFAQTSMRCLFAGVFMLLLADLASSWKAGGAKWEVNPIVTALAERWNLHLALAAAKLTDLVALGLMYWQWKRTRAHIVIGCALSLVSLHYAQIVLNNYAN